MMSLSPAGTASDASSLSVRRDAMMDAAYCGPPEAHFPKNKLGSADLGRTVRT